MIISKETSDYIRLNFKKGKITCLTGAGISAESGIPTFRGKGGLWEKYDPEMFANAEGLLNILKTHPERLADFIIDFYSVLLKAGPSPAHIALAALEKDNILDAVITQNIDNLHQRAGSRNVIELHGNAFRIKCMRCKNTLFLERERLKEMVESLKINKDSRFKLLRVLSRYFPRCACGGRYRTDIVLFGEALPEDELAKAYSRLEDCNTLLLIGTSLVVYPAAGLPLYAKERQAKLIEINNEKSALSDLCDYRINGAASEVLPEILRVLEYA